MLIELSCSRFAEKSSLPATGRFCGANDSSEGYLVCRGSRNRKLSLVSAGTLTRSPEVSTWPRVPKPAPDPASMAAPLPPPAIARSPPRRSPDRQSLSRLPVRGELASLTELKATSKLRRSIVIDDKANVSSVLPASRPDCCSSIS